MKSVEIQRNVTGKSDTKKYSLSSDFTKLHLLITSHASNSYDKTYELGTDPSENLRKPRFQVA